MRLSNRATYCISKNGLNQEIKYFQTIIGNICMFFIINMFLGLFFLKMFCILLKISLNIFLGFFSFL